MAISQLDVHALSTPALREISAQICLCCKTRYSERRPRHTLECSDSFCQRCVENSARYARAESTQASASNGSSLFDVRYKEMESSFSSNPFLQPKSQKSFDDQPFKFKGFAHSEPKPRPEDAVLIECPVCKASVAVANV